jgi:hypothetical protein
VADYITPAAVAAALAIDETDDGTLDLACRAITTHINNVCGRDFRPVASSARYFNPSDPCVVRIHDASSVTAVAVDDAADGLYSTVWATTDWQAQPVGGAGPNGQIDWPFTAVVAIEARQFLNTVYNRRPFVKVTAVWGWVAVPAAVEQAALFLAEEAFKAAREAPFGSANLADFGPVQIRGNRRVDQLLAPYKSPSSSDGMYLVA